MRRNHSQKRHDGFPCDLHLCNALCCRSCPVLTIDEALALAKAVKEEYDRELDLNRYFRPAKGVHDNYCAVKMVSNQCIFLTKEKRCMIYKCRPILCRLYPVIDVNTVDERCPLVTSLSVEKLNELKRRYKAEIDKKIQSEETFWYMEGPLIP